MSAYTLLTDSNMAARRQSVNVAVKADQKGSAPMVNQLLGTAQAEFFAFNGSGHDDLWHMDWRARLVRFKFGQSDATGGVGDAAGEGVPSDGASSISSALGSFLQNDVGAALADQFLLH